MFKFRELFPDLQWEVIMKMDDPELLNLCQSSHQMQHFCNTNDWFWKERIKSRFGWLDFNNLQEMLKNEGNWSSVYLTLLRLNKLRTKLNLDYYNLLEIYNLTDLNLYNHQLTEIPKEIGNLINLKKLNLNYNQLTDLPTEIGNLINLKEFSFSNNQLREIPKEIGNLINLKKLLMHGNKLSYLPKEIGNLTNLKILVLQDNKLSYLPKEIGNLHNLEDLYLHNNQLSHLPREIGNLHNLEDLYLHNNPLTDPNSIKELHSNVYM